MKPAMPPGSGQTHANDSLSMRRDGFGRSLFRVFIFAKKPYQVLFARYKRLQQEGLTRNPGALSLLCLVYPGKRRWTERDIEIIPLEEFLPGLPGFLTGTPTTCT